MPALAFGAGLVGMPEMIVDRIEQYLMPVSGF
jgi:hypothetical protein